MKKILLLLVAASSMFGQTSGANTVTVQVYTNQALSGSTVTLNSSPLQNIGQTSHTAKLRFSSVSGSSSYVGNMSGSTDGTNWFNIGPIISVATLVNNQEVTLVGYGDFPYVRISGGWSSAGGGCCTSVLNETYIGTSYPAIINVDQYIDGSGVLDFVATSLTYGSLQGIQSNPSVPGTVANVVIYGLSVSAPSTLTNFSLVCSSDGSTVSSYLISIANTAASQIIYPIGLRAYGACPQGTGLYYSATGSGTGTANVQYRIE